MRTIFASQMILVMVLVNKKSTYFAVVMNHDKLIIEVIDYLPTVQMIIT